MNQTKTNKVIEFMLAGEHKKALAIASKFRMLKPDVRAKIQTAWAALTNPQFYRDIGKDPDTLTQAGLAAIRTLYGL